MSSWEMKDHHFLISSGTWGLYYTYSLVNSISPENLAMSSLSQQKVYLCQGNLARKKSELGFSIGHTFMINSLENICLFLVLLTN